MRTSRLEVLSGAEVERIHGASMHLLATTGVRVEYGRAQRLFAEAGAEVEESGRRVRIPEQVVRWALAQAPGRFALYGADGSFSLEVGGEGVCFAGLGTPTHVIDPESGHRRPATMEDVVRHIILIDGCRQIHNSQMDIWPSDIPMTTIHTEAIAAWARHSRKPFGMGCYGYLPTRDMMRMMALVAGGKEEMRRRPRFLAICSVGSPLQTIPMQIEGLLICAEYGQPLAMSPEAIAGATAPVTLAGLLAQQNANILAHVTLAQIARPGTPVLYGSVSTIANLRLGTVALGAIETGLISAGAAQMARHYGLPSRTVGATTEAKGEEVQAGLERAATLLMAVLAGAHLITCGGTLDGTLLESEALLMLDDELCGAALRAARGIEVDEERLALELIDEVSRREGGSFLEERHTVRHFRGEHFLPALLPREPFDTWEKGGARTALDLARERVREVLVAHEPRALDPGLVRELDQFREAVAARPIEEFYGYEEEARQSWGDL